MKLAATANDFKPCLAGTSLDVNWMRPHRSEMAIYLREWRKAAGLTLEHVGNKLGIHLTALQKWEKGVNAVDTRDIERLGKLYGVHPSALFYHPEDVGAAKRLGRAHDVLQRMPPDKADHWLTLGEAFAPEPAAVDPPDETEIKQ